MPKPGYPLGATQFLPRILSAALVAGCVWLLLQNIVAAPSLQAAWAQRQMPTYLTALSSGDPAKARSVFDRDIRGNPADPDTYKVVAQACMQSGRYDLALEYLDRGVIACRNASHAERGSLYVMISECYIHTEKTKPQQMAILAARNALDLDPENPEVLNAYGYVLAENGEQLEEATLKIGHALELLKKQQDTPQSRFWSAQAEDSYGWALYKQRKYDGAVSAISQAIADMPQQVFTDPRVKGEILGELYYHLGAAYRGQKNPERARAALESAISYAPNQKDAKAEFEALKVTVVVPRAGPPSGGVKPGRTSGAAAGLAPSAASPATGAVKHAPARGNSPRGDGTPAPTGAGGSGAERRP